MVGIKCRAEGDANTVVETKRIKLPLEQVVELGVPSINMDKPDAREFDLELTLYRNVNGMCVGIQTEPNLDAIAACYIPNKNIFYHTYKDLPYGSENSEHMKRGREVFDKVLELFSEGKMKAHVCYDGTVRLSED